MESRTIIKLSVSLGLAAAVLALIMPRSAKFPYEYKKGSEWQYETLYAKFDFPLSKSATRLHQDWMGSNSITPYYRFGEEIVNKNIELARGMDLGVLSVPVVREIQSIYDRGVLGDEGAVINGRTEIPEVIYIQRNKHAIKQAASEVWTLSAARDRLRRDVEDLGLNINVDSVLKANGVYSLIVPNLVYDGQTTALVSAKSENLTGVTSGYVSTGERIVSKDEIITEEIAQMLDSYRKEYDANLGYAGPVLLFWLGNGILAVAMLLLLFFAIFFSSPVIFQDSRFYYILMVYMITAAGAILLSRTDVYAYCMAPFALSALFLHAFFTPRVILPVYTASLIPMLVFAPCGGALFVIYLLSGLVGVYLFGTMGKGWKQFLSSLIMALIQSLTMVGFRFAALVDLNITWFVGYFVVASFLSVAGYALVPLFELVFNLVSNSRLLDLCDTSNSLIRELEQKAPGTFQHSLQVMNMAEAAARAIDANPLLLRAGAMYHDIGKMNNPQCFVENESLLMKNNEEKYHYSLPPQQSSQDIIRHVSDGVEIAQRHRLPGVIVDFIKTHHGTSHVGYFYSKFLAQGGDSALEDEFRYPGQKPYTKEQVILMLCDSIEAASRSLTEYTPEAFSNFVEKIVKDKYAEDQLNESEISLKELSTFKRVIKTYLAQMHHGRVAYPEKKIRLKIRK